MENYYEILQVSKEATDEELKKSYRELAKKYHPDKYMSESKEKQEEMSQRFALINDAYNTLSNKELRNKYDDELRKGRGNSGKKTKGENTNYQNIYEEFSKENINNMFGSFFNTDKKENAQESQELKNKTSNMFDSFFSMGKKGR